MTLSEDNVLSPSGLFKKMEGPNPPIVIDVRLAEEYAKAHIRSAKNNCVFEVNCLDRMSELVADHEAAVCVYGDAADTYEARMAAEKLCRAGYQHVFEMREGLAGWRAGDLPVEEASDSSASRQPEVHGIRKVDLTESRVEWTGRNLLNKHHGRLGIKSGTLQFDHGSLIGGEFVFDMKQITCSDLQGNALHDVLIAHLLSHDFFDVDVFPEARFVITKVLPIAEATPGSPNLIVHGELTLKDTRLPLDFPATAGFAEGLPAAQAVLSFDRTLWNVIYGSGKFFRRLGGHLVNDQIDLQLRIITK